MWKSGNVYITHTYFGLRTSIIPERSNLLMEHIECAPPYLNLKLPQALPDHIANHSLQIELRTYQIE